MQNGLSTTVAQLFPLEDATPDVATAPAAPGDKGKEISIKDAAAFVVHATAASANSNTAAKFRTAYPSRKVFNSADRIDAWLDPALHTPAGNELSRIHAMFHAARELGLNSIPNPAIYRTPDAYLRALTRKIGFVNSSVIGIIGRLKMFYPADLPGMPETLSLLQKVARNPVFADTAFPQPVNYGSFHDFFSAFEACFTAAAAKVSAPINNTQKPLIAVSRDDMRAMLGKAPLAGKATAKATGAANKAAEPAATPASNVIPLHAVKDEASRKANAVETDAADSAMTAEALLAAAIAGFSAKSTDELKRILAEIKAAHRTHQKELNKIYLKLGNLESRWKKGLLADKERYEKQKILLQDKREDAESTRDATLLIQASINDVLQDRKAEERKARRAARQAAVAAGPAEHGDTPQGPANGDNDNVVSFPAPADNEQPAEIPLAAASVAVDAVKDNGLDIPAYPHPAVAALAARQMTARTKAIDTLRAFTNAGREMASRHMAHIALKIPRPVRRIVVGVAGASVALVVAACTKQLH